MAGRGGRPDARCGPLRRAFLPRALRRLVRGAAPHPGGVCWNVRASPGEPVAIHRVERGSAFSSGASAGLETPQFLTGESAAARLLPWLSPIWIAGVLLFHLRRAASWMAARRLLVAGVCAPAAPWRERLDVLRARLRVARPVVLLESSLAAVPAVVGYVRPVILMPVGPAGGVAGGAGRSHPAA